MEGTAGKQSQVSTQITRQVEALKELAGAIGKLEERLEAVLCHAPNIKAQDEPEQELVSLADCIRDNTHIIEAQAGKLCQILSQLEL